MYLFRSRLFAKFATNKRLTRLVDDHVVAAAKHHQNFSPSSRTKMVTSGSQTSPPPPIYRQNMLRSAYAAQNFTLGIYFDLKY